MEREHLIRLETTVSTNDEVKAAAREGAPSGTAVLAGMQTGGRGRRGRSFLSPPGGAYFSVLYRTVLAPEDLASMTAMAAVAVSRGIESVCALRPVIKWPNDVLLSGRKVCGILCESLFDEAGAGIVIGIGVNVRRTPFPLELRDLVTTLEDEAGYPPDPEEVALAVLRDLDGWAAGWPEKREEAMAAYRLRCDTLGKEITWMENGTERRGIAREIDRLGGLVAETEAGAMTLRWGEVTVRRT